MILLRQSRERNEALGPCPETSLGIPIVACRSYLCRQSTEETISGVSVRDNPEQRKYCTVRKAENTYKLMEQSQMHL
ncbi:hypothetical protein TNCV_438141 [Trichonephila clavipes]|nr:hypothetical protein TNCV_438141 [Trichonephila clavipes]